MAMEMKVYYRKRKRGKIQQIDHIPKCFQLPRSASASKPRTDFSLPVCSFKDESHDTIRGNVDPSSTRSTGPQIRRQEKLKNGTQLSVTEVKLFGQKAHVQPCSNRNIEDKDDALEVTPIKSQLTESSETCTTPGSVVWAKTNGQCWWPAQILGEKSSRAQSSNARVQGHVLVQYFGKHGSSWVDPATDLSPFIECFEERRCNRAKEFQNALKQALHYKEHSRSCKETSSSHDQLPERDNSSSSSRARSKRERKRKVNFDEVSCPLYTSRKVRRFKIMRSLGLAAPVGSPFISS